MILLTMTPHHLFKTAKISLLIYTIISFCSLTNCSAKSVIKNELIEGQWYIDFIHQDIGAARTIIEFNTDSNTFIAHSRINADRAILGNWTSLLARTFTNSLKNGSLINIEKGVYNIKGDTLHLAAILSTPMGSFNLEGHIIHDELWANITNKRKEHLGNIKGHRNIPPLPLENYKELLESALTLTETKIYNPIILDSKEWKEFTKKMRKTAPKLKDDLEMIFAFFYRAKKLPFSHFALIKHFEQEQAQKDTHPNINYLSLEEKSLEVAYLKITSFAGTASEVDSIFDIIKAKNYQHLIIDLRNNTGGTIAAGMAFATHVLDKVTLGGVFLTQKWFNHYQRLPLPEDYKNLTHFTEANYDLIIQGIHQTEGLCLKIIPKKQVYQGKLYVLTNHRTASTCEPIVYELKKQKRAIIIGTTTAGAMLNGEMFNLENDYKMFIPTADYYTSDGYKIDQNGVTPHIITTNEDAFNKAIELIHNKP